MQILRMARVCLNVLDGRGVDDHNHGIMVWHHTRSPRCKSFGKCWCHAGHAGIDHDHDYHV